MRVFRHLFAPSARRRFPEASLQRITTAIEASEARHTGEVCFAVESALPVRAVLAGMSPRDRASEVFAQLRVWDTETNNGVLLYLLLADHRIEIVADRGFDGRVTAEQWHDVCAGIEARMRSGEPEAAVLHGIGALSALVAAHFPRADAQEDRNELPDRPHLL